VPPKARIYREAMRTVINTKLAGGGAVRPEEMVQGARDRIVVLSSPSDLMGYSQLCMPAHRSISGCMLTSVIRSLRTGTTSDSE
jgi:hypothetical protein